MKYAVALVSRTHPITAAGPVPSDNGCHNITILAPDYELALIIDAVEMVGYQTHSLLVPNVVAEDFCDSNFGNASFSVCEGLSTSLRRNTRLTWPRNSCRMFQQHYLQWGGYTGHTYDATYLMGYAIAMEPYYNGWVISSWLASTGPWFGVGPIEFMDNGDLS